MARRDNGLIDLSLPIFDTLFFDIEGALHDYAYSPLRALEKLQLALLSLQETTQLNAFHTVYHSRLSSFLAAVDQLSASGSPYIEHYHSAFLSAADALSQVVIACQFGVDRSQRLDYLLSMERSCWSVVISIADEKTDSPTYINYAARLDSAPSESVSVDAYLDALACAGRVSFHLDSVKNASLSGQFMLVSVQSLSWLQARFPTLQWQALPVNEEPVNEEPVNEEPVNEKPVNEKPTNEEEPLRALCELSFLPLFQNLSMQRDARYRLLELFEDRFKRFFYQQFGALFLTDYAFIEQSNRLVPVSRHITAVKSTTVENTFEHDDRSRYFPVRHGGSVYVGRSALAKDDSGMFYLGCLGHDFLAYFLYEIETSCGCFVFDRAECLGPYIVAEEDLFAVGSGLWLNVEGNIQAQVLLTMPLLSLDSAAFCLLPQYLVQVLVVRQGGQYFALPYSSIREIEGVCSMMQAPRSWVKNVWLSRTNSPLLEPWLLSTGYLPKVYGWPEKNKSTYLSKNGYYFGKVCGRMFWVEAELVLALLPYQAPFSFAHVNDGKLCLTSFIVHDGRCLDKVLFKEFLHESLAPSDEKGVFSVILEGMGESVVLPFASCDWYASLPDGHYVREFDLFSESMFPESIGYDDERCCFAALQEGVVVIDKKNYLSFVAGFWPSSSLA